jgi:hypothetical protein
MTAAHYVGLEEVGPFFQLHEIVAIKRVCGRASLRNGEFKFPLCVQTCTRPNQGVWSGCSPSLLIQFHSVFLVVNKVPGRVAVSRFPSGVSLKGPKFVVFAEKNLPLGMYKHASSQTLVDVHLL